MNQIVIISLLLTLSLSTSGCIIPFPHVKQTCPSVSGKVIDKETTMPISNAEVNINYGDGGTRKTFTNASGAFEFSPKNRFYWGVLFAVALNHSLPLNGGPCCVVIPFTEIDFVADNYASARLFPEWHSPEPNEILKDSFDSLMLKPLYEDNKLIYPQIPLKRRAQGQTVVTE